MLEVIAYRGRWWCSLNCITQSLRGRPVQTHRDAAIHNVPAHGSEETGAVPRRESPPMRVRMRDRVIEMIAVVRAEPCSYAESSLCDICEMLLDLAAPFEGTHPTGSPLTSPKEKT